VTPIHPVIAPLIEAFVNSVIVPASRSDCTNDPISEDELSAVFSDLCVLSEDERNRSKRVGFTTQLLLVYYVLLYEDTLLTNMSSIGMFFLYLYFFF